MTLTVLALVLAAALLHATWNAMLRGGADRGWSMMVMSLAVVAACTLAVPWAGTPSATGWVFAFLSGVLHVGYGLCLVRMYRSGDLGQTYPIARGSSPLLVSLGAAAFAGEVPDALDLAGVVLVCAGIMALAFRGRRLAVESIPAALATGCFIGAYSVADGLGVRASGNALGFIAWSNLLGAAMTASTFLAMRRVRARRTTRPELLKAAAGGLASLVAYGAVIWALGHAPMGAVSALRETSVVFAALLGRFFLAETLTFRRIAACVVIALGAACLGFAGAPH